METLFGLEMTKKQKILVLTGITVGVIGLLLYLFLAFFEQKPVTAVAMPKGGLTSSIFDSQNQTYKSEAAFQTKNSFINVPYTIDTVEGQKAVVGNASVYEHAPYYFYYSELQQGADLETTLKNELTSILVMNAEPKETQIEVLHEESGFVNGCSAGFYMIKISVAAGDMQKNKYMSLYRLHLDDSVYATEWDMLVGCMSEDYSTEGLLALQTLSYSSIGSLKFDEKAHKRIEAGQE